MIRRRGLLAGAAGIAMTGNANAATYPSESIRWIVPRRLSEHVSFWHRWPLRTAAPGMILSRWALHWCLYWVPLVK